MSGIEKKDALMPYCIASFTILKMDKNMFCTSYTCTRPSAYMYELWVGFEV